MGGWGLLDMQSFGRALLCKSLWRAVHGVGPWCNMIQAKYLKKKDFIFWYRKGKIGVPYGSFIWNSLRKNESYFLKNHIWHFQNGSKILIGRDQFKGSSGVPKIPELLLSFFHRRGHFYWDSLIDKWQGPIPIWKSTNSLKMPHPIACQWDLIKASLRNCGIFCSMESDFLIWCHSKEMNNIRVKEVYQHIMQTNRPLPNSIFPHIYWKDGCQSKMIHFAWLNFHNKILTWDNLRKRGWIGPGICPLCRSDGENNDHLFIRCHRSQQIWQFLEKSYGFKLKSYATILDTLL